MLDKEIKNVIKNAGQSGQENTPERPEKNEKTPEETYVSSIDTDKLGDEKKEESEEEKELMKKAKGFINNIDISKL